MLSACPHRTLLRRWILFCLLFFITLPTAQAVTLPQAAVASQQNKTNASNTQETPGLDEKKAAYAALANILENDESRQELIDQLRNAATAPADTETPELLPPTE